MEGGQGSKSGANSNIHSIWDQITHAIYVIFRLLCVGVLGPRAYYPHLYWAQNPSRGLGGCPRRGNVVKGAHVSERSSQIRDIIAQKGMSRTNVTLGKQSQDPNKRSTVRKDISRSSASTDKYCKNKV